MSAEAGSGSKGSAVQTIGVLTSGGDASGMNAAVRAVVRSANARNVSVIGVQRGFYGLMHGEFVELNSRSVADVLQRGGTFLKSARCEEFKEPAGQAQALGEMRRAGMDGLVVIGGGGSFRGAQAVHRHGVPVLGIPATIDNDIPGTDRSIGFDTAVNTVVDAIDKIRDTAYSHERVCVVEVMGRNAGCIALYAGLAGGAESILVPEVPFSMDEVCERIERSHRLRKAHSIVVVAEGAHGDPQAGRVHSESSAFQVGEEIRRRTGFDTRITILGHLQRGGTPSARDRVLASQFGYHAVELLLRGESGKMLATVGGVIEAVPFERAFEGRHAFDMDDFELASLLSSL